MNSNINEKEKGRSMIEMLGVLAIIGVLSVGGIAGYSKAMHRYRLNKAIEQITYAAGAIHSFFAPQKNFAGLSSCSNNDANCQLYKKAKLLPDDMWDETAGRYIGVYGYQANANTVDKAKSGDGLAFRIVYFIGHTEESIEACIDLITHDWGSAGVKMIYLGGPGGVNHYFKTPVAIDVAVDKCESTMKHFQTNSYYGGEFPEVMFYFDVDLNSDYWKSYTFAN